MERKAIFVSPETHKELKLLAVHEGTTFDETIKELLLIKQLSTTHRDEIVRRLRLLHEIYDIEDEPHIPKMDAIAIVNDVYEGKNEV